MIIRASFLFLLLAVHFGISAQYSNKLSGITLVAPRNPFSEDPMPPLSKIDCEWIAVIPYAFTPQGEAKVMYGRHQWWGETPEGAEATIELARKNGMKVMLKPQLWMHHNWVGALDFDTDEEWNEWEEDYREYILDFASIASRHDVEIFCIGTEFKIALKKRTAFWRKLIGEVREIYKGTLTYCANWDEFEDVNIWDELDLIGVSAYFPLINDANPETESIIEAWKPIKRRLRKTSLKYGIPVFFAEYGYMSLDGATWNNWELEKRRREVGVNEDLQARAIEAMFRAMHNEKYWAGGFLWKWYPGNYGRQEYRLRDYTPQGKLAEEVLKHWHEKINGLHFFLDRDWYMR